jgi:hypothetical protein
MSQMTHLNVEKSHAQLFFNVAMVHESIQIRHIMLQDT